VVVEVVFTSPGIGHLLENSITSTDYPTVQALLMIFVTTFAAVNLAGRRLAKVMFSSRRRDSLTSERSKS
jgi:ABC-type dipeptide/oligopeptide/nickel transport system permease component